MRNGLVSLTVNIGAFEIIFLDAFMREKKMVMEKGKIYLGKEQNSRTSLPPSFPHA